MQRTRNLQDTPIVYDNLKILSTHTGMPPVGGYVTKVLVCGPIQPVVPFLQGTDGEAGEKGEDGESGQPVRLLSFRYLFYAHS